VIKPEDILMQVIKPARYLGNEWNAVKKDFDSRQLKLCLCFPDAYEVGMSHLGLKILYHLLNEQDGVLCERSFAPWFDMEELMRKEGLALFSLESRHPLSEFDVVGFSLQYEMSYTNVLNMLDLAGIPLKSKDRTQKDPLVIGGGPCVFNPEPVADFFDAFLIGEGEEALLEMIEVLKTVSRQDRGQLLRKLSKIPGVYVPQFYSVGYNSDNTIREFKPCIPEAPAVIKKRIIEDFDSSYYPEKQIVPYIEVVHDRISLEVMRGCPNRCAFCHATAVYHPRRERKPETILKHAEACYQNTGYDEVSLVSLSTGDHSQIFPLIKGLIEKFKPRGVAISLPSLRIEDAIPQFPELISLIKKTGLTFAPEAGSRRLRKAINKNIDLAQLEKCVSESAGSGWKRVKLYFMTGLPSETEGDIQEISELIRRTSRPNGPKGRATISVTASINSFVPKPQTPFQWEPMDSIDTLKEKQLFLKKQVHSKNIKLKCHDAEVSFIEGVLSRGDRRLSDVITEVWRKGGKFEGWSEYFKFELWQEAFCEKRVDPDFYVGRKRSPDEKLPWDFIDCGIPKDALWKQRQRLGLH